MSVETHLFDSGLKVAVEQVPSSHTIAVNVMVGIGGLDETEAEAGLSHLLEHCVHKQTDVFPDQETRLDYEKEYQYLSGAVTTPMHTLYYARGVQLEPMLRGLASQVATPALRDEHVAEEVAVVTREAKMNLDNPVARSYFAVHQHLFNSPYSRPVIGYWQKLGYSGEDVRAYFHKAYSLGEIAVVATGKASMAEVVESVDRYLEQSPLADHSADSAPRYANLPNRLLGQSGRYGILGDQHNNVYLQVVHPMDDKLRNIYFGDERFAYYIASNILGSSVAKSLREDRQLSYDGEYWVANDDHPATWRVGASVTCEPLKIEDALEAFDEGVTGVLKLDERKLRLELQAAEGFALQSLDDISSLAARITSSIEYDVEPLSAAETVAIYKRLTPDKVAEALQHLVAAYNNTEKYIFVGGDEEALEGYPIIAPTL